jgi:adenosylcobyric acid synthase
MSGLAPVLMVQGTASSAGKSTIVAGLCRLLAQRGLRVAPFKAQNMSNNATVCSDGGEIGRAQFSQAIAARIEPTVDMNPILLKPQGGASQLIVRGQVQGVTTAQTYWRERRQQLWPVVVEALDRLRASYDVVIAEGAGSPAEINLRDRDIVNMRVALHADADVLLVADVDRGGALAALLGTWQWLAPEERALVRGFILNKFRGDPSLLAPAPAMLEAKTGIPLIGVVPFLSDLRLPEEDAAAASFEQSRAADAWVEIAVVRLPHIANFDEFSALAAEAGVNLRYVTRPDELRAPDLVILPGTKATIPDLLWLHDRGLANRIRWLAQHGTPVLGICGGYQMLGDAVHDPGQLESDIVRARGLALFPLQTELAGTKRLVRSRGLVRPGLPAVWSLLGGVEVEGYEIHVGRTSDQQHAPFLQLESGPDGNVKHDGSVVGTYVHGLFEQAEPRHALVRALAETRGLHWSPASPTNVDAYDDLARVLAETVSLHSTCVGIALRSA